MANHRINSHSSRRHPIHSDQVLSSDNSMCRIGTGVGKDAKRPIRTQIGVHQSEMYGKGSQILNGSVIDIACTVILLKLIGQWQRTVDVLERQSIVRVCVSLIFRERDTKISLHQLGFIDALAAAEKLKCAPKEITIIGIEPKEISQGLELTEHIEQKIPEIINTVLEEIEDAVHTR